MVTEELLRSVGTWAYVVCTSGFVAFVGLYAAIAPWRKSPIGRMVMIFFATCATILVYGYVAPRLGLTETERLWSRVAVFTALGAIVWRCVITLLWAQWSNIVKRGRHEA